LYQRVAGIEPTAPGYTGVVIKPYPVGDLSNASAQVGSPLGGVSSHWSRAAGQFTLTAGVPVGATAAVFVPAGSRAAVTAPAGARFDGMSGGYAKFTVGSGTFVFRSLTSGSDRHVALHQDRRAFRRVTGGYSDGLGQSRSGRKNSRISVTSSWGRSRAAK